MTRYSALYDAISKLEQNSQEPILIPKGDIKFPFDKMYPGQKEIIESVGEQSCCITSHTGFGKSACFASLTRGHPSLIIEPRKFLQSQLSDATYHDFQIYGRSGYPCPLSPTGTANVAPCLTKEDCADTNYRDICEEAGNKCGTASCKVFEVKGRYHKYPCEVCEYNNAVRESIRQIKCGNTVICNFGNFWRLLPMVDTVVIDEADLFFKEISNPVVLKYTKPKDEISDILVLMDREVRGLQAAAKDPDPKFRYTATNLLYNAQFLKNNAELCFTYQRKDKIYVEIDPRNTNILKNKLFKDKRVIIVSATASKFDLPSYSASIHQRCGIFFAPVGNLTSRNLKANPYLMSQAAKTIAEISEHFELVYDNKRVVIHAANLSTHSVAIYNILGKDDCTMHTAGKLAETIETYLKSNKRYLIVASAEYGADFWFSKLQFGLKYPYPNLDERMNTLRRNMGPEFSAYYSGEARTRTIQMAGRVSRGHNDFGCTVLLDSKYHEDYIRNFNSYPQWYSDRVNTKVY
jgi:hypothetical protein